MVAFDKLNQPIWQVSPYPIIVTSYEADPRARKIVYVNDAFTDATGYAGTEAVGMPARLLHGSTNDPAADEACEAALRRGKPCAATFLRNRKDGSTYRCHATIAPLVEPVGPPGFLISIETPTPEVPQVVRVDATTELGTLVPLTLPMPLLEFSGGQAPAHLPSHPALDELRALWAKLLGDRPLPLRQDFDPDALAPWASHISLATVTPDARFQFRVFGAELSRVYGRDLTGTFLDELTPSDLWSVVTLHYKEVAQTKRPLFAPISIANGRWYSEVSRLLLPLAAEGDGDVVAYVLGADYSRNPP